ncbi:MAG: hypothetical protein M3460_29750 [Actinomycetota bacterium]|nr:hypothetical protein [Actinomycetota bacterium]
MVRLVIHGTLWPPPAGHSVVIPADPAGAGFIDAQLAHWRRLGRQLSVRPGRHIVD